MNPTPSPATPTPTPNGLVAPTTNQKWECFCDESYYDYWAVRPVGENRWGHCFHLINGDEAKGLCDLLNDAPTPPDKRAHELTRCAYKAILFLMTNQLPPKWVHQVIENLEATFPEFHEAKPAPPPEPEPPPAAMRAQEENKNE